jgi:hypothetical protein
MELKGNKVLEERTHKDVSLTVFRFSISGLLPDDIYIVKSIYIGPNIYDITCGGTVSYHWSTAEL